jgi:hypothetical protein
MRGLLGELLLGLDFLESYDFKLRVANDSKVGKPFKLTKRYVEFLMYLFSIPIGS